MTIIEYPVSLELASAAKAVWQRYDNVVGSTLSGPTLYLILPEGGTGTYCVRQFNLRRPSDMGRLLVTHAADIYTARLAILAAITCELKAKHCSLRIVAG